jgi:16S rRNA (uracil1498-N3)-methyltransferase
VAAAHVFVIDLTQPALDEPDRHHLERVLRLRPGEEVTASDGSGGWRRCRFGAGGALEPVSSIEVETRPEPRITVGFALTKGDRPGWTVQKLVEVGVDRIVPMTTMHTVVRWDGDKSSRQAERLRSVARGAAMQSRRVWLPVVEEVQPFAAVAARPVGLALAQMGGAPPGLDRPTILVGPEGGWDESELASELPLVTLGPTVLRAETAATAAGLLLCGLRAGVVKPGA